VKAALMDFGEILASPHALYLLDDNNPSGLSAKRAKWKTNRRKHILIWTN
jgi:hypothetical protein